jgi:hypothetical protein
MHTSVLLIALSGVSSPSYVEEAPTWHTDYSAARKQCQSEKKPMAVFVNSGKEGWHKLAKDGSLGNEIEKTLATRYVCLYVDSATMAGKALASALGLETGRGLVISDSSAQAMAFYHEGGLANRDMARYLNRFADPDRVVQYTETNPAPASSYQSNYPPAQQRSFGGLGGGRGGC